MIWRRNPRAGTTDGLRKLGPLMADRFRHEQQSRIAILRSVSSRMHRIWMRAGRSKVIGSVSGPFHRNFWYPDHEFVFFFFKLQRLIEWTLFTAVKTPCQSQTHPTRGVAQAVGRDHGSSSSKARGYGVDPQFFLLYQLKVGSI